MAVPNARGPSRSKAVAVPEPIVAAGSESVVGGLDTEGGAGGGVDVELGAGPAGLSGTTGLIGVSSEGDAGTPPSGAGGFGGAVGRISGVGGGAAGWFDGTIVSPTRIVRRPAAFADASTRTGCCRSRSSTTRVLGGAALCSATRTRLTTSTECVTDRALVSTPGKSRNTRGGPPTSPTIGSGNAPSASIVTTAPAGEGLRRTVLIVTGSACPCVGTEKTGSVRSVRPRAARGSRTTGNRTMEVDVIQRLQRATESGKE